MSSILLADIVQQTAVDSATAPEMKLPGVELFFFAEVPALAAKKGFGGGTRVAVAPCHWQALQILGSAK